MQPVTNVYFDPSERRVFAEAAVWIGLAAEAGSARVLRRLAEKDPTGIPHMALLTALEVLREIRDRARTDIETWQETADNGPEDAPEGSFVANPRQAAQVLIESRLLALRVTQEARDLLLTALHVATPRADTLEGL